MSAEESRSVRPLDDYARMIVSIARAAPVDVVLVVTESGKLFRHIVDLEDDLRVVAATPSRKTYQQLTQLGLAAVRLPVRVTSRYRQSQHAIDVALHAGKVAPGELVQCVVGQGLPGGPGDFVVLMDVSADAARVPLHELLQIVDGVRANVLDAALQTACRIGLAAHRGKRVGAMFMVGDSQKVLEGSRQLILNPLHGHDDQDRMLTNPATRDLLLELAKLDGAFVIRGDGFIHTGGTFLDSKQGAVDVSQGLGARHVTVAAVTARTKALGIAVSATDGNVRVFSQGKMVMLIEPDASDWTSK